jgi:ABC-type lipoprotein release transport system permease subunit
MKALAILVGSVLFIAVLLSIVIGIPISMLIVAVLAFTLLFSGEWVPVVYNVRSLGVRKWTTGVTAGGLALVVAVFATVLMLATGVRETLKSTGSDENVKVLRKGSQNEVQSGLLPENVQLLKSQPEVAHGGDNQPLASRELVVLIFAQKANAANEEEGTNVTVRGVDAKALELHQPAHLEGRMFQPGTSEIVVGRGVAGRFAGAQLGQKMRFARRDWEVVGVMDQRGSAYDSEIWCDVEQAQDAFQRRPAFSSVTLKLTSPSAFATLKSHVENDPMMKSLDVRREPEYWEAQSEAFGMFVKFLGIFVAVIFAIGAILGAMITMYAQVAARTREIGTLRALGFRRRAVLVSFVVESVLLAIGSGGVGIAVASLVQLIHFSSMNFQTFSEVRFGFHMTPLIALASMLFAAVMGYAGGLLPAVRASRMPIVQATRGG